MKNVIVFYRGSDVSSKIASATISKFNESFKKKFFNIEIINLDKRNIKRFFDKIEDSYKDYDFYIFEDEENLLDYIKENFKDVSYFTYNDKECKNKWYSANYSYLAERIIEEYKKQFGKIELWKIKYDKVIEKIEVYKYDYENSFEYKKEYIYHKSEKAAREYLRNELIEDIEQKKKSIENLKKDIENKEKLVKKLNSLLK